MCRAVVISPLLDIIKDAIRERGAIDLETYMGLCLSHPEHGYYMTRDPFGRGGDFITAPEVSQMFGEMIGLWLADTWIKLGSPEEFILLECGPGRGTLMEDIFRATKNVAGFHRSARLYLMEISPVLKDEQARRLGAYAPTWIAALDDVPSALPVLLVANEFLDALPVRQLERQNGIWYERQIVLDEQDRLCFALNRPDFPLVANLPGRISSSGENGIFEISPVLNRFIKFVDITLLKQRGAALFIDYGHGRSAMGDAVQAMRSHRFVSVFDTPGCADITAHVDFENITRVAQADGVNFYGPTTQGAFLKQLGIDTRAERLMAGSNSAQREALQRDLKRLTDTEQMGSLFKVLALCNDPDISLEGFDASV